MQKKPKQQRLFYALWPDNTVRKQLTALKSNIEQKFQPFSLAWPMLAGNFHITLAFLGNIPSEKTDCLLSATDKITFKPFDFILNHLGVFNKNKVLWLGMDTEPADLIILVSQLENVALHCGLPMEKRPFKPHLTLFRKVKDIPDIEVQPIYWKARDFCLVSSVSSLAGVKYEIVKRWL